MIHIKSKFKEYDTYQIKLIKKLFECVVKNECKKYLWFMKQLVFISFENDILTNVHMHVKSRQSPNIYIFVSLKISVIDL